MNKPKKLSFPVDLLEDKSLDINSLEASIWNVFDEYYEIIKDKSDDVYFFATQFDMSKDKSIFIEYLWHVESDTLIVVKFTIYPPDKMPDSVLDRLIELQNNNEGYNNHLFEWEQPK